MPTIILFDISLSMFAHVDVASSKTGVDLPVRKSVALTGVASFLEYLHAHNCQEFVSVATFSHDASVLVDFTKDYASAKEIVLKSNIDDGGTKTNLFEALYVAMSRCVGAWGASVSCNLILVTDCVGDNEEFRRFVDNLSQNFTSVQRTDSATVPVKPAVEFVRGLITSKRYSLHVVCVNDNVNERDVVANCDIMRRLISEFGAGDLQFIGSASDSALFQKLAEKLTTPTVTMLKCGSFSSAIEIFPELLPSRKSFDFEVIDGCLGDCINVFGFMKPQDLSSPPVASRHLVLASKRKPNAENVEPGKNRIIDDEKTPNFCVLLHGAMKMEDMAAAVEIGQNLFGFIYHVANAKRSNLILHCYEPGPCPVLWLGKLSELVPRPYLGSSAPSQGKTPFPVANSHKPSYASSNPNWIHTYGLQADLQKVLRYAKKLPEKEIQFKQELTRICNYASALGFTKLLTTLTTIFENELANIPAGSMHATQLKNAIKILNAGRSQ